MTPQLSHVAILVPSAEKAAAHLRSLGFSIGPTEVFEGEGTREIYVGGEKANSLLLMEPAAPGSYQRALEKRGPGFHHFAVDVPDLEAFVLSLSSSGWLLHPRSIHTMKKVKTAYLARPGFPALIEVQERAANPATHFVDKVELIFAAEFERLLAPVGLQDLISRGDGERWLSCAGKKVPFSSLL